MTRSSIAEEHGLPQGKALVLFDGYCNLCNGAVQFILKRDKKNRFYFAGLSWEVGKAIRNEFPGFADVDSILVYQDGKLYGKSSAALKIAARLGGLWPLMGVFWILPRVIRDAVYSFIARNRYKWFGKRDSCMIPEKDLSHRFLDNP